MYRPNLQCETKVYAGFNHDTFLCPQLNTVWVTCEGEGSLDKENIGEIQYIPKQGFQGYFYPYMNTEGYLSPLVAIYFKRPKSEYCIAFYCYCCSLLVLQGREIICIYKESCNFLILSKLSQKDIMKPLIPLRSYRTLTHIILLLHTNTILFLFLQTT